ncbi:NAD-dependent epimerase/dehydratase family protein [Streptacidiphilus jiangxiensis]|uniref:UDP-glucose 4-epimerase/dTDP-L-rhamnose 4-epimerase n=1 Tax=Streptacidiphilus jiangxiensis TaxID=235985 RepID=A0A1H8ABS7_STRJI|nr:NAD-dependent epimerase/dehydratase family protein [Streptacidiphilus jiangxiensis]SEM67926.1 UDP-glucose 4-epimerase/dTDP-L-rhamnose 4-epimerase [Streptacidiphilus jiangxiensis]
MVDEPSGARLRQLAGATVLVTGGGGLVGSRIVAQLAGHGAHPLVLDSFDAYPHAVRDRFAVDRNAAEVVLGDVRERATVGWLAGRADFVIHAAAYADVAACTRNPNTAFASNVHGTQTVLDAVAAAAVKRLVFISSASVYGDGTPSGGGPARFTEDQPLTPISVYANTKVWAEHQVRLMLDGSGTEHATVRYFSVYGDPQVPKPDSHSWMVPWMAMSARTGRPIRLNGGGSQVRDMVHVDDIAHATILALATDEMAGQTVNVGTGVPTTVREIGELIAGHYPGAEFAQTPRPEGDPLGGYADTRRAADLLGWKPGIRLAEGIERYVAWLKATPGAVPDWFTADTAALAA